MQKKIVQVFMVCLFMAAAWGSAIADKGSRLPLTMHQNILTAMQQSYMTSGLHPAIVHTGQQVSSAHNTQEQTSLDKQPFPAYAAYEPLVIIDEQLQDAAAVPVDTTIISLKIS